MEIFVNRQNLGLIMFRLDLQQFVQIDIHGIVSVWQALVGLDPTTADFLVHLNEGSHFRQQLSSLFQRRGSSRRNQLGGIGSPTPGGDPIDYFPTTLYDQTISDVILLTPSPDIYSPTTSYDQTSSDVNPVIPSYDAMDHSLSDANPLIPSHDTTSYDQTIPDVILLTPSPDIYSPTTSYDQTSSDVNPVIPSYDAMDHSLSDANPLIPSHDTTSYDQTSSDAILLTPSPGIMNSRWKCSVCWLGFSDKFGCQRHIRRQHRDILSAHAVFKVSPYEMPPPLPATPDAATSEITPDAAVPFEHRIWKCSECWKEYILKKSCQTHIRRHHYGISLAHAVLEVSPSEMPPPLPVAPPPATPKEWKCSKCGAQYGLKGSCNRHIRDKHGEISSVRAVLVSLDDMTTPDTASSNTNTPDTATPGNRSKCSSCNKSFSDLQKCASHVSREHQNDPLATVIHPDGFKYKWKCPVCRLPYQYVTRARAHIERDHPDTGMLPHQIISI